MATLHNISSPSSPTYRVRGRSCLHVGRPCGPIHCGEVALNVTTYPLQCLLCTKPGFVMLSWGERLVRKAQIRDQNIHGHPLRFFSESVCGYGRVVKEAARIMHGPQAKGTTDPGNMPSRARRWRVKSLAYQAYQKRCILPVTILFDGGKSVRNSHLPCLIVPSPFQIEDSSSWLLEVKQQIQPRRTF